MKNTLIVLVAYSVLSGCAQTGEQLKKNEDDHIGFQKNIALLAARLDTLDSNIAGLYGRVDAISYKQQEIEAKLAEEKTIPVEGSEMSGIPPAKKGTFEEPVEAAALTEEVETTGMAAVPPIEEIYNKAIGLYGSRSFGDAIAEFDLLISAYPDTDLTDNALYWRGECYYSLRKYQKAIAEFERVVNEFPRGNKAPDSQIKIGFAYIELKDTEKAINALQKTMDLFPLSDAASMAAKKLSNL